MQQLGHSGQRKAVMSGFTQEEPQSHFYQSQGLRLHYVVWGREDKPPLLLVHGGRDHCRSWDFVAQRLKDRFRIYAPDLRGHGDSDWAAGAAYNLSQFLLDLALLTDTIEGPVTIIGHSMGGALALQYAAVFPERTARVVAIEGLGPAPVEDAPLPVRMRQWIHRMRVLEQREPRRYASIEEAARRMMEVNPRLSVEVARHLSLYGTRCDEDGRYSWKFDRRVPTGSPYEFDLQRAQEMWSHVRVPVLLISGSDSGEMLRQWDVRATVIPNHRSVVIEGAGHWVHHDQLERFLEVVGRFLAGE